MLSCALDRTAASSVAPPLPSAGVARPCFSPMLACACRLPHSDPAFFGTRRHMTGDPMLLMLGDHIYRSTHEQGTSCVRQHVWHPNLSILARALVWPCVRLVWPCWHSPLQRGQLIFVLPVCVSTQVQQLLSSYDGGSIMAPTHVHMAKRGLVAPWRRSPSDLAD